PRRGRGGAPARGRRREGGGGVWRRRAGADPRRRGEAATGPRRPPGARARSRLMRVLLWVLGSTALPVAWFAIHFGPGLESDVWTAVVSGAAIFGAAFLLSWATEVAQLDIPRALALTFLALVAVFPEYAVDVYFAWRAGKDPAYTAYATAHITASA